mmetsp:Transcript_6334/g.15762  ORF Transcript_6334/g.15762 Transcript_6334/m.15762 type:complete len:382 (+) Transcript_6334:77-1222(+)
MAISYEEALATLQSMFSDQGYTSQQLDAVLRHFGGHMENTVETLLTHGEGTPDELMQKLTSIPVGGPGAASDGPGGGGGNAHNIDADEELARQLAAEDDRQQRGGGSGRQGATRSERGTGLMGAMGAGASRRAQNAAVPPGQRRPMASTAAPPSRKPAVPKPAAPNPPAGTKGRGTPTVLPSDFLRIPGRKYPSSSSAANSSGISEPIALASGPGGMGQMMTDEQMARMLQDELFQEELRNNPEFSHLAGRRNPSARSVGGRAQTTGRSTYGGAGGGGVGWGDRTDFFDRVSELGDKAKLRFQEIAANWNDPNRQNQRPLFGGGGGAHVQSNANANTGNERRGLLSNDLNMEEEEEMEFIGGGGGNAFEMNDVGSGSKKKD